MGGCFALPLCKTLWSNSDCKINGVQLFENKQNFRYSKNSYKALHINWTVAYAGFWKVGSRKFRKIENNKDQNENFSTQNQSGWFSCPKSDEHQKKKSLARVKTKNKRSSLKFSPVLCPKLGEDQKKKGLHSNLVQFLAQTWVQAKNKGLRLPFVCSNLLPKFQKGACRNFAYYSMPIMLSWRPKGGPWPNAPPKYAPATERLKAVSSNKQETSKRITKKKIV